MTTVSWGDSNMVYFLLERGANPRKWPDMSEVLDVEKENWYLEEIDICYMHECWANDCDEDLLRGWAETARVLIKKGGLKNFYGFALTVNNDGTGEIGPAKLKY